MDKIGDALMKLVESGAPLAADAIRWWFIIRLVDTTLGYICLALFLSTVLYAVTKTMTRWKEFSDAKREYWTKNRY